MTRNRWILLAAAGLVLFVFAYDRLFLSDSGPAPAEAADRQADRPAGGKARPAARPQIRPLEDPALDPLNRLAEGPASRNVFTPSARMLQYYQTWADAQSGSREKGPPPGSPEAFAADHQLQATSTGLSGAMGSGQAGTNAAGQAGTNGGPQPNRPGGVTGWLGAILGHPGAAETGQPGAVAIVDGKPLRVGETLDGFRLIRITPCTAEFQRGRDRVTLIIPPPGVTEKAQ